MYDIDKKRSEHGRGGDFKVMDPFVIPIFFKPLIRSILSAKRISSGSSGNPNSFSFSWRTMTSNLKQLWATWKKEVSDLDWINNFFLTFPFTHWVDYFQFHDKKIKNIFPETQHTISTYLSKVWVFWEGHKIWRNLRRSFDKSDVFCARNSVFVKKSTKFFSLNMWTSRIIQTSTSN